MVHLQTSLLTHTLKVVSRSLHQDRQAMLHAWYDIEQGVGTILDKSIEETFSAFTACLSFDPQH